MPVLWQASDVRVTAICDIEIGRLRLGAARFPLAKTFTDYSVMLSEVTVDGVVAVATPQVHYAVARQALNRNAHIFVEKPPAVTTEELRELLSSADRTSVVTGI